MKFQQLLEKYNVKPDRRGEAHVTCPNCGKSPKRGHTHFSFSEHGGYCFVCGTSFTLDAMMGERARTEPRPVRTRAAFQRRSWMDDGLVEQYESHPDKVDLWQDHKPLTREMISVARLGVGILPEYTSKCRHTRLVVPVFKRDRFVGLRGRAINCDCPKWLTAAGSMTMAYGMESVKPGKPVWIIGNMVDSLLIRQAYDHGAIASTVGETCWYSEWSETLKRLQPSVVVVALDNDLVGQAHGETRNRLYREWMKAHEGRQPPRPFGPRIVNDLLRLGLNARLFQWPDDAPARADVGWLFERGLA